MSTASQILKRFHEEVEKWADRRGYTVGVTGPGGHFVRIRGENGGVLYVKVRSETPGFWGITQNRVDELTGDGERWAVVLLSGRHDRGYLMPAATTLAGMRSRWRLAGDGDYKVNEPSDVEDRWLFEHVAECVERFVGQTGSDFG